MRMTTLRQQNSIPRQQYPFAYLGAEHEGNAENMDFGFYNPGFNQQQTFDTIQQSMGEFARQD